MGDQTLLEAPTPTRAGHALICLPVLNGLGVCEAAGCVTDLDPDCDHEPPLRARVPVCGDAIGTAPSRPVGTRGEPDGRPVRARSSGRAGRWRLPGALTDTSQHPDTGCLARPGGCGGEKANDRSGGGRVVPARQWAFTRC